MSSFGAVEGSIVDSVTGEGLPGIEVHSEECSQKIEVIYVHTDEHGHYRAELPSSCFHVGFWPGEGRLERTVEVAANRTTHLDFSFPHDALAHYRDDHPAMRCPNSPPNTYVEGHTISQSEIDAVAAAVLERYASDATTVPDSGLLPSGQVAVQSDISRTKRLTRAAIPAQSIVKFKLRSRVDFTSEADRFGRDVKFIHFSSLDSDGSCAIVTVGGDFVMPTRSRSMKGCCCIGVDLYEKHDGRWSFVRRDSEPCA
jgi:hypothetical protein